MPEVKNERWDWQIDLAPFIGRTGYLTTRDGIYREGKISAIKMREFDLAGSKVQIPEAIELNGDFEDVIPFDRLAKVDVD